jgi:hypothetical protein
MEPSIRPLGIVMEVLGELGHEISYAYDDLVFVQHNDFLLQFGDTGNVLSLFFNCDCPAKDVETIEHSLIPAADRKGLSVIRKGRYSIDEKPDENLEIKFFDT